MNRFDLASRMERIRIRGPSFPHRHKPLLGQLSELVNSYTKSLFETPVPTSLSNDAPLDARRKELDDMAELFRVAFLEVEVLRQSLAAAEQRYAKLCVEFKDKVAGINEMFKKRPHGVRLPYEIVSLICKMWFADVSDDGVTLEQARVIWGDIIFDSLHVSYQPTRLLEADGL